MSYEIENKLRDIESQTLMDQYDLLLQLAEEITSVYKTDKSEKVLPLVEAIADKIHALRYKMAYNKATDSGPYDSKLKRAWNNLERLGSNKEHN